MKLVDEINKLLSPRQANAGSKNQKQDCPQCGTKLPKYVGQYPNNCPGCNTEFGEAVMNISDVSSFNGGGGSGSDFWGYGS